MKAVFLGYSCNNSCVFCAQGALRSAGAPPETTAIAEALKSSKELAFQGGEPTLREDLPALIKRAKAAGASWILLQTNGRRLIYPGYAKELKQAGLDACEVALQGSSAAMHDYHTGVAGGWLQTVAGLKQAAAAGLKTSVSVVVTRSNFRHLAEIAGLAKEVGAWAIRFELAQALGKALASRDRVVPSPELAEPFMVEASERARRLGLTGDARKLFAGLGPTESPAPETASAPAAQAVRPRSKPGLREVRAGRKKSGEDLKAIFPALFEPGGGA